MGLQELRFYEDIWYPETCGKSLGLALGIAGKNRNVPSSAHAFCVQDKQNIQYLA